jgi:hypothetical protein
MLTKLTQDPKTQAHHKHVDSPWLLQLFQRKVAARRLECIPAFLCVECCRYISIILM